LNVDGIAEKSIILHDWISYFIMNLGYYCLKTEKSFAFAKLFSVWYLSGITDNYLECCQ